MRLSSALPFVWRLMPFDKNTVVLASAGTGKTRKLVDVYLELLERGMDPLRIVAVTFTEKAAAEMRDRIRSALFTRPGQWMKTTALLPAAPISTIHGFCGLFYANMDFRPVSIRPSLFLMNSAAWICRERLPVKRFDRKSAREMKRSSSSLLTSASILCRDAGVRRLLAEQSGSGQQLVTSAY